MLINAITVVGYPVPLVNIFTIRVILLLGNPILLKNYLLTVLNSVLIKLN